MPRITGSISEFQGICCTVEFRGEFILLSTANRRWIIRVYGKINIVLVFLKKSFSIKFGHLITSVLLLCTRYNSVEHTNMHY